VRRWQETVSVLSNSVHKALEFSFAILYADCCSAYQNVIGSAFCKIIFRQAQQQNREVTLTKFTLRQSISQALWHEQGRRPGSVPQYRPLPSTAQLHCCISCRSNWNNDWVKLIHKSGYFTGFNPFSSVSSEKRNGTGFTFRELFTSTVGWEMGKLRHFKFSHSL